MLRGSLCFALLFLLAPAPGRAQPPAKDLTTALTKKVTFPPGLDDPNVTVRDVLEYLTKVHGLKIDADVKRIKAAGVEDVLACPLGQGPVPAQKNVSVGVGLQQVLNRLPVSATYVVQGNGVLVVPVSKETIQAIRQEAKKSLARAALARSFTADQALADKPTLDNLVRYLKEKHDLTLVVSAGTDPDAYRVKLELPRFGTVNLQALLEQVADQTQGVVLLRHDHVLLITRDAGKPPVG
jgi:hypothetical protein